MTTGAEFRPVNVAATHESGALRRNDAWLEDARNRAALDRQIAPGFQPNAQYDLSYFGGPTIAGATVHSIYVGGDGTQAGGATKWAPSDVTAINGALAKALADTSLETVMGQYFAARPTVAFANSTTLTNQVTSFQQSEIETMVTKAYAAGSLTGDPTSTLFCFLLSQGTELFASDGSDSHNGLGGYHGSVSVTNPNSNAQELIYYATGVYSETSGGVTNGIVAFDLPWKNVVATFYHEINEWRTDANVENATGSNVNGILGWYSQQYGEIGDIPITESGGNLSEVFLEVDPVDGSGKVPVQLMYSNFDHGPAQSTSAAPGSAIPAAHAAGRA